MHSDQIMCLSCRSNSYKMHDASLQDADLRPLSLHLLTLRGTEHDISFLKRVYTPSCTIHPPLTSTSSVLYRLRDLGLDVEYGAQQVLNHLVLALFARILNLLDLLLGLLVCVLLGLLVSLRVLEWT